MNRTDLTLIFVACVVVAMVIGWLARWFFDRLNHKPHDPDAQAIDLANAQAGHAAAESELNRIQTEYASEYNQLKAELDATMDGLGSARQRADGLQAELDALRSPET